MLELAVVAELARRTRSGPRRRRRARRPRRSRSSSSRTASRRRRRRSRPAGGRSSRRRGRGRSPRAGRSRSPAVGGDPLGVEGDVAADVDEDRRPRLEPLGLALEVLERHAEVLAIAVDELDFGARPDRGERRRHEGVGRAEHGLPPDPGELERGQRAAGPAREAEAGRPFHSRPRCSKAASFGPPTTARSRGPRSRARAAGRDPGDRTRSRTSSGRTGLSQVAPGAARLAAELGRTRRDGAIRPPRRRLHCGTDRPRPGQQQAPADRDRHKAARTAPPSGVDAHASPKISGARVTGTRTWTANIDRRDVGRRAALQRAHLAQQAHSLGSGGGRQPDDRHGTPRSRARRWPAWWPSRSRHSRNRR